MLLRGQVQRSKWGVIKVVEVGLERWGQSRV